MFEYPDAKALTDNQRQLISLLLYEVFLIIRYKTWNWSELSPAAQDTARSDIHNVADAFHNVPLLLWSDSFSLSRFEEDFLRVFCKNDSSHDMKEKHLRMLDRIKNDQ